MEPFNVTPELRALYQRAIENASSITDSERAEILRSQPPHIENPIIQEKFNLRSRQELIAKAKDNPESLTLEEADYLAPLDYPGHFMAEEDIELMYQARDAVTSPDEAAAIRNCWKIKDEDNLKESAKRRRRRELIRTMMKEPRARWVQKIVDAGLDQWGFVCFRTAYKAEKASDADWELFKGYYHEAGRGVSLLWRGLDELWPSHMSIFISDITLEGFQQPPSRTL
ncbi:unnamed protein product [Parascedosporium putredinis]|uniref:Uncharacterized protein n=1 Tax=Parascedosporium putredinis TaxID=1442378 RepID=A0A9P1H1M8_9PEZI|nr:unnamed protein product [Parascedosporium putredinis]CAI7993934.1 unnamed protein product [Parascedosporium putredinis]